MDNDQRDRRDRTDPDAPTEPEGDEATRPAGEPSDASPSWPSEPAGVIRDTPVEADERSAFEPQEPYASAPAPDWTATVPGEPAADTSTSAAEIESWPSQDVTSSAEAPESEAATSEPVDEARAWPTEPPAAGSASTESWPTTPPERDAEPVASAEPPPSEIEAYPAESEAAGEPPLPAAAAASAASVSSQPDDESQGVTPGESTQCPRCGTENRPGLAFCRNCGQRLVAAGVATTVERPSAPEGTMACPRCGTHNRAGVAFCQNCGANLRGTAPGYVPPTVAEPGAEAEPVVERRGAILGPVVLLIGLIGLVTGYLLPFLYGSGSLFERAFAADGYGAAFWAGYPEVGAGLADQAYFGLAGPVPVLALLLGVLAIAGFVRARPGLLQAIGLAIALLWSVGLIVLFVVVELAGNWGGDLVGVLRELTPAGIIFFLASLIVLIGTLTRFGRS